MVWTQNDPALKVNQPGPRQPSWRLQVTVYDEIRAERQYQDATWPGDHDGFVYVAVLAEECGEVARAVHDMRFCAADDSLAQLDAVRQEAVQVAAVAVQIVERIDSGRWEA